MYQPVQKVEKRKSRWSILFAILGSAAVATLVTWLLMKYGQSSVPFTTTVNPTFDKNNDYMLDFGKVNSETDLCSKMGRFILKKNGSAVDSAITTMICNGIMKPSALGIGGFIMTIIDRKNKQVHFLNAKDETPLDAGESLDIGVPDEVAGYWEAHQKYGKLTWFDLFEPNLQMCPIQLRHSLKLHPHLCDTIKIIAENGANGFYNGTLGEIMIEDSTNMEILMDIKDLNNYSFLWTDLMKNGTSNGFAKNIQEKIDDEKIWNNAGHHEGADHLLKNHGTSHMFVVAPNGDAVAVTTSFYKQFESQQTDNFLINDVNNELSNTQNDDNNEEYEIQAPIITSVPLLKLTSNFTIKHTINNNNNIKEVDNGNDISTPNATEIYRVIQAARVLTISDQLYPNSTKACDDFYKFACGGFLKSNDYNPTTYLKIESNNYLASFLEQDIQKMDYNYIKLTKTFYKDCVAVKQSKKFEKFNETWPVIIEKEKYNFNFNKTTIKIRNDTEWLNLFFNIDVDGSSVIGIAPNEQSKEFNKYYAKMMEVASSFYKGEKFNEKIKNTVIRCHKFGVNLMDNKLIPQDFLFPLHLSEIVTFDELKKKYGFFNWEEYIKHFGGTPPNTTTKFFISNIKYMKNLQYLLATTDEKTLVNFFEWLVHDNNNRIIEKLKSKQCLDIVKDKLPISVMTMLYQNINDKDKKNENAILPIISDVKEQILKMINESNFIDDPTKEILLEKIQSLQYMINFPKEFENELMIDQFYKNLKFSKEDNYVDKNNRITIFNQQVALTRNTYWNTLEKFLFEYNACYTPRNNFIVYSPYSYNLFFDERKASYMTYSTVGRTIGHEITHALKEINHLYDFYGNEQKRWSERSLIKYDQQCRCLVKQYGSYSLPGMKKNLDGKLTLRENIADNAGIKAAYRAYVKKLESWNDQETFLNFNQKQLFWISYAQSKCQKTKVFIDTHAMPQFRVNVPLLNMKEFSNDFQCPLGSKMNPIKKCTVW